MQMIIKNIKLKNFKGTLEQELSFCERENIITGDNGVGKTTILDAITWCLFGKDFIDRQQFDIKPIIDKEVKNNLMTSVELTLDVDNKKIIVEKIWDKDTTKILVDGTSFKVSEFKTFLEERIGITEQEFKALTSVEYIPNLHLKELRQLITSLVGEVTNEEILLKGGYDLIQDKINSVGIEKAAQDIRETKSTLNDQIKQITGNIDEKTKDIDQLVVDSDEEKQLNEELVNLQEQLKDYEVKSAEDIKKQQSISNAKNEVASAEREIAHIDEQIKYYKEKMENYSVDFENKKKSDISNLKVWLKQYEGDIENSNADIKRFNIIRSQLKSDYDTLAAKEIKVENDKCPVCNQQLPEDKMSEALAKSKEKHKSELQKIVDDAGRYKTKIAEAEEFIKTTEKNIEKTKADIEAIEKRTLNPEELDDNQKEIQSKINSFKKAKTEKEALIKSKSSEIVEFIPSIDKSTLETINARIIEINKVLATSNVLDTFKDQLKKLENIRAGYLSDKELLNEKEQQLIRFNNDKAEVLRQRVKDHFKLADFIVDEETKDGSKIETFKIALNGIEYSSLNYGHRILVALDLIDGIQKLKSKRLPILIDGLGELTRLPFMDTQVIGCRAKKQDVKKIELELKEAE
jgi:DNA repair exonuclease SbcCD ATPase subunit